MEHIKKIILFVIAGAIFSSFVSINNEEVYSLTVNVSDLKNSAGVVQFSLYNKDGSIPDKHYEKYYKQLNAEIVNKTSIITFNNLPKGTYAINILHDEDENGKIKIGFILPVEGIGFSNIESINPMNRPSFKKAKFELDTNKTIKVKIIYL